MEELGDYTIQKKLGEGPFGEVYLAQHRFLKRSFALKILPEEISSNPIFMRRFEAEVGEIAQLDHPNIAKIYNISCAEGRFFIVTDPHVDSFGETIDLARFLELKRKSLSEPDWRNLLSQAASALDYAHEAGIVHGSLKPSNILISSNTKGIHLFLADFGLARLIGESIYFSRLAQKVAQGFPRSSFVDSYGFLAPEQKREGMELTPQVDSYAFGVLVYYLLFQKTPEGCFDLPSRSLPAPLQNWDLLLCRCLQNLPDARPQKLVQTLDDSLGSAVQVLKEMLDVAALEPEGERIIQMDFALEAPSLSPSEPAIKPILRPQEIVRPEYEPDPGSVFQRETHVSHYTPMKLEVKEIDPLLTEMIVITGGTYLRGSKEGARDEMPRHPVHLSSFALDIHPVTNEQFVRFVQAMGGEKDHNNNDIIRLRDSRIKRSGGKLIIESGYAKHPVVGVTWYGAFAYAKWIGKRLPTEAEWEAAASSGRDFVYPTGIEIERGQANFFSSDTTAVMSYPPNPFGLYDIAGNVYEWCQDWYAYNYYDASAVEPDNPLGPPQGVYRVLRGGCWKSLKEDLRCSHRHRNNPGAVNGTYGFRCAADVSA